MSYIQKNHRPYKNPRNYGKMKNYMVSSRGSNASCGDKIIVYLKIEGETIEDISFIGEDAS